jgi:hypothetical protein
MELPGFNDNMLICLLRKNLAVQFFGKQQIQSFEKCLRRHQYQFHITQSNCTSRLISVKK